MNRLLSGLVVAALLCSCTVGGENGNSSTTSVASASDAPSSAAPIVLQGIPATAVSAGNKYVFTPTVAADNGTLSFTLTGLPAWASFDAGTGTLTGTPTNADVGLTPDITIAVSNGVSNGSVGPFTIRVTTDSGRSPPVTGDPPIISGVPPEIVAAEQNYDFAPKVSDASGKPLAFSIVNRPVWATFSTATGELSGTPTAAQVGGYSGIVISVLNGVAAASLAPFTITVTQTQVSAPTLESIAISPHALVLASGSGQQLTVSGTYSDGSTHPLASAAETFRSSNSNVAAVGAGGEVTVAANAAAGSTATISATDEASGKSTSAANSAIVSVMAPSNRAPTANSIAAAKATAQNNALCDAPIKPFYWEIGDQTGPLASGSLGSDSSGTPVLATTKLGIASASKWIYSTYVTQMRGSAASLTSQDVNFLHFTSGYTNMVDDTTGSTCPKTTGTDSVNQCLTQSNSAGALYSAQDPATVGKFDYNGGHMENHASQLTSLGPVVVGVLGQTMAAILGSGTTIEYTEPLMSGGIYMTGNNYALILRHILDGSFAMHDALGTHAVCTRPSANCDAVFSPILEAWHYSIGHWVEDDPNTGDGTFSSPGAFGFYPWIESTKTYYGIISRAQPTGTGEQQGYASVQCGRLIRRAWMTGVEQTGPVPSN